MENLSPLWARKHLVEFNSRHLKGTKLHNSDISCYNCLGSLYLPMTQVRQLQASCGPGTSWSRSGGSRSATRAAPATSPSWTRCCSTSGRSAATTTTGSRTSGTSAGPRRWPTTATTSPSKNNWARVELHQLVGQTRTDKTLPRRPYKVLQKELCVPLKQQIVT